MTFRTGSDCSTYVYFGDVISVTAQKQVASLLHSLEKRPFRGLRNLHPAYASLLIVFDPLTVSHNEVEQIVLERKQEGGADVSRSIEIPVHYDGPDLKDVAQLCNLSEEQVIALHTGADYLVYFVGFVPGFAYLGGLPKELEVARLASPRKRVAPGSVGIAGNQTGVYPIETPGGWRLIGHTDIKMFDERSLLEAGDHVRFTSID